MTRRKQNYSTNRMGLIKEFKEFAVKGNMIDMAVGIIIGTAFNAVVDVLVKQIIMPPLSLVTDGVKYSDQKLILRDEIIGVEGAVEITEVAIGYGMFLEVLLDFLIIGFTVFLVIKFMNRFRRKAEDPKNTEVKPARNVELLENISRLMEEQNSLLKNQK